MKINININNIIITLLTIFITLKLLNIITWSWLWVLSPLWLPPFVHLWIFIILSFIKTLFS